MRKLLVLLALLSTAACIPGTQMVVGPRPIALQQFVTVTITNNCSAYIDVSSAADTTPLRLRESETRVVQLIRPAFAGTQGYDLKLLAKAYTTRGSYLGLLTGSWNVETYHSGYEVPWNIDRLESPQGAQCKL